MGTAKTTKIKLNIDLNLQEPNKYVVILLNDDYSTMDFVVHILISIFKMDETSANNVMLKIHKDGKAVCGIYTHEIALTKVDQVHALAKEANFPLQAILEKK